MNVCTVLTETPGREPRERAWKTVTAVKTISGQIIFLPCNKIVHTKLIFVVSSLASVLGGRRGSSQELCVYAHQASVS